MTEQTVRDKIHAMATLHGIKPTSPPLEKFAEAVTRLSGDDVFVDDTDRLLINLAHAGFLDDKAFMDLSYAWQVEKRQYREIPLRTAP